MNSEIKTQIHTQQSTDSNMDNLVDYSKEFKLEMENSISIYFSKCDGDSDDNQSVKSTTTHNETLIDNTSKDVEYVTPTSLKGISDFMIHQVFSTERIVPIESDDEDSKLEATEVVEVPTSTENKMSSFNSDDTLNNNNDAESSEKEKEKEEEDQTNPHRSKTISKSFADEFINLLNINMKELNSKNDDFHVIGLKKIEETKENTEKVLPTNSNETNEIKVKEEKTNPENNDNKPKSNKKKSKYISLFNLEKGHSFHISHSKSTSEKSTSKTLNDASEPLIKEMKKSKSKLYLFIIFKIIKKKIQKY